MYTCRKFEQLKSFPCDVSDFGSGGTVDRYHHPVSQKYGLASPIFPNLHRLYIFTENRSLQFAVYTTLIPEAEDGVLSGSAQRGNRLLDEKKNFRVQVSSKSLCFIVILQIVLFVCIAFAFFSVSGGTTRLKKRLPWRDHPMHKYCDSFRSHHLSLLLTSSSGVASKRKWGHQHFRIGLSVHGTACAR